MHASKCACGRGPARRVPSAYPVALWHPPQGVQMNQTEISPPSKTLLPPRRPRQALQRFRHLFAA